jgi:hypothetical protein
MKQEYIETLYKHIISNHLFIFIYFMTYLNNLKKIEFIFNIII